MDTKQIDALQVVADAHHLSEFAHLCNTAREQLENPDDEQWAVERVADVRKSTPGMSPKRGDWQARVLAAIRATDTTRPDGAIARRIEV